MRFDLSDLAVERVAPTRSFEEVEFEEDEDGYVYALRYTWFQQRSYARILNFIGDKTTAAYWRSNEIKRLRRITRRLNADGFRCVCCGEELPLHRNANSLYCRKSCGAKYRRANSGRRERTPA